MISISTGTPAAVRVVPHPASGVLVAATWVPAPPPAGLALVAVLQPATMPRASAARTGAAAGREQRRGMGGLLSAPLIMPCAARPCHVTRDADTPPRAPAALVTVVLVLPGARGWTRRARSRVWPFPGHRGLKPLSASNPNLFA